MINDGVPHEVPSYEVYEFQEKQNRYCVCVFVINEGSRLLRQLEKMEPHCRGYADIVVADGGSFDGSTEHEKLKKLGVNTLLVKTGPGKLGSQMRMAFDWALKRGYDGVVTMDGNGKDGVEEVANFVYELKNGWDHIQGSRFKPGGIHLNTPKSRLLGLKLIHAPLMRLASGFKYTDTTNGYRAYSARFLSSDKVALFRNCFEGYELHYYMAIEAAKNKFKVKEIPVTRVYPPKGKIPTKISGFKSHFDIIKKLLLCCIGYYRLKKKMSWKKISVITMLCIALVIAINALLYVGTGLYLQVSDKTLLITTIRPCDKNEKVNVYGIDSNGIKSEENALCFNIGYNKLIATLIKKDKASGCEIQSNDRQAYYANVYLTDLVFFNEIIESSNITKTVKFSEENFTIPAITDSRWQNGIGKKHNGFFLETKEVAEKIGNGDVVIIDDQEEHIVKNIKENGKYIEFDVVEKISIADPQNSQHTVRILIPEQNIFSFKFDKTVKSDFKLLYGLAIITFLEIAVFLAAELCVIFIIMLLQSFFRVDNKSELSCNLYEDKKNKILKYCFISIVVSIIATLTLYPGIIYSDSLSRIKSGIELLSYSSRDHISTPQSIVGIILYAVSIKLFGSIALVSVIQAFMFFISIFLVCDLLCERNKSVIIAFLCICPCILGSSVFHETNINALTFMLLAFWLIMCPYFKNNWFSIAVLFITLTVCMMLLFNFRPNAIAVAPVFLLFITINFFRSILLKRRAVFVTQIVAVFAAIVLSNSLTDKFVENSYSFIQPGFLWKGISVLQEIPDND